VLLAAPEGSACLCWERNYWRGTRSLSLLLPPSFGACPQPFKYGKKKGFAAIVIAKPKKMVNLLELPMLLGIALGGREVSSFKAEERKDC